MAQKLQNKDIKKIKGLLLEAHDLLEEATDIISAEDIYSSDGRLEFKIQGLVDDIFGIALRLDNN